MAWLWTIHPKMTKLIYFFNRVRSYAYKLMALASLQLAHNKQTHLFHSSRQEGIQSNIFLISPQKHDEQHTKKALIQFVDNVGPNQCVHLCSLIWAFFVRRHILQYIHILHWVCKGTTKAQISLRLCAGWSGPVLSTNYMRAFFMRCASYIVGTH